jgi:hypothetical protein
MLVSLVCSRALLFFEVIREQLLFFSRGAQRARVFFEKHFAGAEML